MRCQACDAQLKSTEGRWNARLGEHEYLCRKCLVSIGALIPTENEKSDDDLVVPTIIPKGLRE